MKNILNLFKSEPVADNAKWSKWSIINFIILICVLFAMPSVGLTYSNLHDWGIEVFQNLLLILFFGWIYYLTKKSHKKGLIFSKIAFYGVILLSIVTCSVEPFLSKDIEDIKKYAITNSPKIANSDLTFLKTQLISSVARELSYSSTTVQIQRFFSSAGKVDECSFIDQSKIKVDYKFYSVFGGYELGKTSNYSIRCFGDIGYLDLTFDMRKEGDIWKIVHFTYASSDPALQEEVNEELEKINSSK